MTTLTLAHALTNCTTDETGQWVKMLSFRGLTERARTRKHSIAESEFNPQQQTPGNSHGVKAARIHIQECDFVSTYPIVVLQLDDHKD